MPLHYIAWKQALGESPEQVRAEKLDQRTDLFSFGVVLYEMATKQRAFPGDTAAVLHDAIRNQIPAPARNLNSQIPARLEAIISKAIEKDRSARYQTASEVRADLEDLQRQLAPKHLPSVWAVGLGIVTTIFIVVVMYFPATRVRTLTMKDTIILADFINTTGDSVFDDGLKTALNVSLQQSPLLNVLPDAQVTKHLQLMTRSPDTRVTLDIARELCRRSGSKAYITGSIAKLDGKYVMGLKAVTRQTADTLANEQGTAATREGALNVLETMAISLRKELGESLTSVQKFDVPLEEVTTSSLEA